MMVDCSLRSVPRRRFSFDPATHLKWDAENDAVGEGTSGKAVGLLDAANTWSGAQTFDTNTKLQFRNSDQYAHSPGPGATILGLHAYAQMQFGIGGNVDLLSLTSSYLLLEGSSTICCRDVNEYIQSSVANTLDLNGNTTLNLRTGGITRFSLTSTTLEADVSTSHTFKQSGTAKLTITSGTSTFSNTTVAPRIRLNGSVGVGANGTLEIGGVCTPGSGKAGAITALPDGGPISPNLVGWIPCKGEDPVDNIYIPYAK